MPEPSRRAGVKQPWRRVPAAQHVEAAPSWSLSWLRPPHLKRRALHDVRNQARPAEICSFRRSQEPADCRLIVMFQPAAEGVGQEFLDHGLDEIFLTGD